MSRKNPLVEIKVSDNGLGRKFLLGAKSTGFAMARGMNDVMKHAEKKQRSYMDRTFNIRSKSLTRNSVKVVKYARASDQTAVIAITDNLIHVWRHHEEGQPKTERSQRGGRIAVPQSSLRSRSGRITKAKRPRNLKNSFLLRNGNRRLLFQKKGRGKNKTINLAYSLVPTIQIGQQKLNFVKNVSATINKRYDYFIEKAVAKELQRKGISLSRGPV